MKVRRAAAMLLAMVSPAIAQAADNPLCPALRAIINADGRDFADLRIVPGRPLAFAAAMAAVPAGAPRDCDLSTGADEVSVSCTWVMGDYAAVAAAYTALVADLESCTGIDLPASTGPSPYGGARALRTTNAALALPRGETNVRLYLVETAADSVNGIEAYHYLRLSIDYELRDPEE